MGRPKTGQTPVRSLRLGPVWDEAEELAKSGGRTMTDVVDALLRRWIPAERKRQNGRDESQEDAEPVE